MSNAAPFQDRQIVTVDVVLLTIVERRLSVGLLTREHPPLPGSRALVGGYVHADEDANTEATAARVLREKTGLEGFFVEQLATFSGPHRDPRGWSLSVAYLALTPYARLAPALESGSRFSLSPVDEAVDLPFDHGAILAAALARLSAKGAYSTLPARLLPEAFTLSELQRAYEIALGAERIDKSSFRRKLNELDIIEPIAGKRTDTGGRQAQLYRTRGPMAIFDRRL